VLVVVTVREFIAVPDAVDDASRVLVTDTVPVKVFIRTVRVTVAQLEDVRVPLLDALDVGVTL
jgi:hypothetical protein